MKNVSLIKLIANKNILIIDHTGLNILEVDHTGL